MNAHAPQPNNEIDVLNRSEYTPYPYDLHTVEIDEEVTLEGVELPEKIEDVSKTLQEVRENVRVQITATLHFETKDDSVDSPLVLAQGKFTNLEKVLIDGVEVAFEATDTKIVLPAQKGKFTVTLISKKNPAENKDLRGLYSLQSGGLITQMEAYGMREFIPFPDRPDVMPKVWKTTIKAPKQLFPTVLATGAQIAHEEDDTTHKTTYQLEGTGMNCYLYCNAIGNYALAEREVVPTADGRQIPVEIFVSPGREKEGKYILQAVLKAMKWDEEEYGLSYPYDTYRVVVANDFNFGAMENTGLNIFNSRYALANPANATDSRKLAILVVGGHEYFHSWSGNVVTLRTWHEIALKEGFTVFREACFEESLIGENPSRVARVREIRDTVFARDASPQKHAVLPETYDPKLIEEQLYDAITYPKAGELIRMLRTWFGKERFMRGAKEYFERFKGQAVTIHDLLTAIQEGGNEGVPEANRISLDQFRQWYQEVGTPVCHVTTSYDESTQEFKVKVEQGGYTNADPLPIPMVMELFDPQGNMVSLEMDDATGHDLSRGLIMVTSQLQEFKFKNVPKGVVPSFFRGLSAPVKVNYPYSNDELVHLMAHETDAVNKYDASSRLAKENLHALIAGTEPSETFLSTIGRLLETAATTEMTPSDAAVLSEMLTLPSVDELVQEMKVYDYKGAKAARERMMKIIAERYHETLQSIYGKYAAKSVDGGADSGEIDVPKLQFRQLQNVALKYLGYIGTDLAKGQLANPGGNMSNELTAFKTICENGSSEDQSAAIASFYEKWQNDDLVLFDWFRVQAMIDDDNAIERTRSLLTHPAYNKDNPNVVRAVLDSFINNPTRYHTREGYKFVFEQIATLKNKILAVGTISKATEDLQYLPPELRDALLAELINLRDTNSDESVKIHVTKILGKPIV